MKFVQAKHFYRGGNEPALIVGTHCHARPLVMR